MSLRRTLGLTFVALCLALPAHAVAQRPRACAPARTTLLDSNSTQPESYLAMATMVNCYDAPATIAAMLRKFAPNSAADTLARHGAWALLDTRLADSIGVLALDVNESRERRLFFLRLLTRYVEPSVAVDESSVNSDAPSVLMSVFHPGGVLGTSPPTPDSRDRARATIRKMGSQDPDPMLRKLAGLVYEELKDYMR